MNLAKAMKIILAIFGAIALSACSSDVSQAPPHDKLVGKVWRLKKDSYVIRLFEDKKDLIVPCDFNRRSYFPGPGWQYDERRIGEKDSDKMIEAGLRSGQLLQVVRVIKYSNPEAGDRYDPIAVKKGGSGEELSLQVLYKGHEHEGVLNPEYAELVR
jgi:hypothetical protein